MTTRAHIVIDGIKLYCHADGYPSYMVGYLLQQMRIDCHGAVFFPKDDDRFSKKSVRLLAIHAEQITL